ncbi:hypothetical protein [Gordonia sp. VNK21]|uniref:hypothetical protein n=1 Tax=Gordonia sp. VNK21 TaxID=3382483 RepID=UPI0038D3ACA4
MRLFRSAGPAGLVLAAVLAVAACTVPGQPSRAVDLAERAVAPADFPYGAATAVPAAQVPGALADITFRPLRGEVSPPECTPAAVDTGTAQIRVGPGGPAQGTLTTAVVKVTGGLDELEAARRQCPEFTGGATGAQRMSVTPAQARSPEGSDAAVTAAVWTLSVPGGAAATRIDEWIAQRGDIRVYVQNRHPDGELDTAERTATEYLFDTAVRSAFG